jgi:hypothetical protein
MKNYQEYLKTVNKGNEIKLSKGCVNPYKVFTEEEFIKNQEHETDGESVNFDHSKDSMY